MTPPPARFFGRIRRADIECPKCGRVFVIGDGGTGRGADAKRRVRGKWNARLQRFTCPKDGYTVAVGLIAYGVPDGGGRNLRPPADTEMSVEQALEYRNRLAGVLQKQTLKRSGQPVNVLADDRLPEELDFEDGL